MKPDPLGRIISFLLLCILIVILCFLLLQKTEAGQSDLPRGFDFLTRDYIGNFYNAGQGGNYYLYTVKHRETAKHFLVCSCGGIIPLGGKQ